MKRVITLPKGIASPLNETKYLLIDGDDSCALYAQLCANGMQNYNSWLLVLGQKTIIVHSYNNKCYEEMLDMMDDYKETGHVSFNGFLSRDSAYGFVHMDGLYIMNSNYNTLTV